MLISKIFSPCSEPAAQTTNSRNSAPGSFKSLNHKLLKTYDASGNGVNATQRTPKPYRAPSEESGQEHKLRDIKHRLQRFSTGSTEHLGPERKSSAVSTITRVIKRQMTKERSGSQPNLSNLCSDSLSLSPPLSTCSPASLSNLSPALAKIEISRGATVSVPSVKLQQQQQQASQDVPMGVRGSPDGASIRSESPLPPSEQHGAEQHHHHHMQPPRIIHHGNVKMYPSSGTNQLPHKVVPTQVVMRSKFSKGQGSALNKQRHSLPPPPSYSSHVMNSSSGSGSGSGYQVNRKEFALSGADWSAPSVSPRFYYEGYDSDIWPG